MEQKKHTCKSALLAAVLMSGCLDLTLLDDMTLLDTGGVVDTAGDGDAKGTPGSASSSDNESVLPETPVEDPSDSRPPEMIAASCPSVGRVDGAFCVIEGPVSASVRFSTDEPAVTTVSAPDLLAGVFSADWEQNHWVVVAELFGSDPANIDVSVVDVNGNRAEQTLSVSGLGGPAVVITEVYADPVGAEPAQEFVELTHIGDAPLDLSGWMIDDNDDADGDVLPEGTVIAPGETLLLVSPSFDPASGGDPTPSAGTRIIALESSIGSNGLKNGEAESVELFDSMGVLVSQYRGEAGAPKEGLSAHRHSALIPRGDPGAYDAEPAAPTPGAVVVMP